MKLLPGWWRLFIQMTSSHVYLVKTKDNMLHKGENRFHEDNMTLMTSNACALKASFKLQRKESENFSHEPLLLCSQSFIERFELGSSTSKNIKSISHKLKNRREKTQLSLRSSNFAFTNALTYNMDPGRGYNHTVNVFSYTLIKTIFIKCNG